MYVFRHEMCEINESFWRYLQNQNQTGCFPTKWDRAGRVVQVNKNDKYVVKVDGSGRLTLRNCNI